MKLSIVTVNYNAALSTINMVQSVREVLVGVGFEWEIIVVDNGSMCDDVVLLEAVNGIVLVKNGANLGFAGGNNCGLECSTGEYIMLLNNDTRICSDIFTPMISFFAKKSNAGAVSPMILYDKEPYVIQYAGYDKCDNYLFNIKSTYHGACEKEVLCGASQTPFVHGAAVMFRRNIVDIVGPIRDDYFLYFEELDYSLRILEAGYEVWCYPFVKVFHNASHTTSRNSYNKIYYNSRNRLYFATNNLKGKEKIFAVVMQLLFSLPKNVFKSVVAKDFSTAKAYLHGAYDFCMARRGKLSDSI